MGAPATTATATPTATARSSQETQETPESQATDGSSSRSSASVDDVARTDLNVDVGGRSIYMRCDRAGVGSSEVPPEDRRTTKDQVADLVTLLDGADLTEPLVLVAHSLGSLPAIGLASHEPERVAGAGSIGGNKELAAESADGRVVEVEDTGHNIHEDQPEVVRDAIRDVLAG